MNTGEKRKLKEQKGNEKKEHYYCTGEKRKVHYTEEEIKEQEFR